MSRDGRLFPELNDKILDLLADDHKTLAVCALVCSGWRTRSQYLLFKRFELVYVARSSSKNQNQKGEKYDRFIHRLRTTILANPSIVDKVRDGVHAEMFLSLPFTNLESLCMRYGIDPDDVHLQHLETPPVIRLSLFLQSNLSLRRIVMDSIFDLAWKGTWGSTEGHRQVDLPIKRLCWYEHRTPAGYEISGWGSSIKLSQLEELALLSGRSRPREMIWFLKTCAATLRHLPDVLALIDCPDEILENILDLSHLQLLDPCCQMFRLENFPLESKLSRLRTLRSVTIIFPRYVEIVGEERHAASWADRALASLQSPSASQMAPNINVCVWNNCCGGMKLEADIIERIFPVTNQLGLFKDTLPSFWWPSSFFQGSGSMQWV